MKEYFKIYEEKQKQSDILTKIIYLTLELDQVRPTLGHTITFTVSIWT